MQLELIRKTFTHESTIGELLIDGVHFCFTLEPAVKTDGSKPRAIPEGCYRIGMGVSPRFAKVMPHVQDVPDFQGILIHWGNFPKDTEGCILVGSSVDKAPDMIDTSMATFNKLLPKLLSAPQIAITIHSDVAAPEMAATVTETASNDDEC